MCPTVSITGPYRATLCSPLVVDRDLFALGGHDPDTLEVAAPKDLRP